ncbi:kinectin-like isoform X2 [Sphaerodactylus townsendi]|uniref:kinectin-like isoform X2 n=1 Tax=Sphaerodactylus townsendi TaxID=933632 RepID=UPI002026624A|nr:kinectin-like isoform X2 [Sphaerodactylus townsendi]
MSFIQWDNFPDANAQEKLVLMEEATNLRELAALSTQDVLHKEAELLNIQRDLKQTVDTVKEKERNVHLLETQLHHQIQKLQDTEGKLTESRLECIRLQALLQQLKEEHLTGGQSTQHIVQELRKEAEKLKQMLDESKLSADEDKYLFNKMAEDYGHLVRKNGLLQTQVLEATWQLSREKQLREENASHSRRVSELVSAKGEERHLEKELTYLMTLLRDSSQRVLKAQDQLMSLQQQKESANRNEHSLQSQLRDAEWRHSSIQLENFKLQTEKTHLVEYVSHLHKQIAEKEREIHCLQSC